MRITVLTHATMPFGLMLARAFADRGREVRILSLVDAPAEWRGVPVEVVGPVRIAAGGEGPRLDYLRVLPAVRAALARSGAEVVLAPYLSSAGLLACLSGHPRVVPSALGTDVVARRSSPFWHGAYRWMDSRSAFLHAVSEPLADDLVRMGIRRDRIVVAPIGIELDRVRFTPPDRRPDRGVLLTTRAHGPVYDQPTLLRALARLRGRGIPATAVFASGRDADRTRTEARLLGIEDACRFLGGFPDDALSGLLGDADAYVSCSLHDGTSQSLLEALAAGLFPVVTDIAANRPWVRHGETGLLWAPGDDAALADALARALADPGLRARAARANRARAERDGDLHVQADRLLEAFERFG